MKDYLVQAAQTAPKVVAGRRLVPEVDLLRALEETIATGNNLDILKKSLFYGKDLPYTTDDSQVKCIDFAAKLGTHLGELAQVEVLHGIIGIITESSELAEALVNAVHSGAPLDMVNLSEECGDVLWYMACILRHTNKSFHDLQVQNIAKLRKRYPNGFLAYDALNRDLGAERSVLEADEDGPTPVSSDYTVQVVDDEGGFRFRLYHTSGRASAWGVYTSVVMLDEVAAATDYYTGNGADIQPMHAVDMLAIIAVK